MFKQRQQKTYLEKNWQEFWISWNIGTVTYQKIQSLKVIYLYRLKRHALVHTKENSKPGQVSNHDRAIIEKSRKRIEINVQPLSCRLCLKFFLTPPDFENHLKTDHLEDDNFDIFGGIFDEIEPVCCRICMKEFNNPKEFHEHVQSSQNCIVRLLQKNVSKDFKLIKNWNK